VPPDERLFLLSYLGRVEAFDAIQEGQDMPRYVIERYFPDGLGLAANEQGRQVAMSVVANNAQQGVTWVHSYVTSDKKRTFCVYDGPSPEAIRKVAERNGLSVERISEVSVLDPYFLM
jgi:hypothetical protein